MAYYYAANEKQKEEIKKKYDNDLENQKKDIKERSFCILGKKQLDKNSNQDALITPEEYIIQQNKAIKTLLRPKDNMDVEVQKEKFEQFFETIIKDKHTDKKTKNPTFKFEIDNDESDFIFKISWIPDQKWHEPHHDYELYIKHPIKTLDNQKTIFCKQYKQLFYRFKILGFNTLMKIALIHEKDKILIDKENDNIKVIEINHNNKKIIINAKCHAKLNKFLHEIIKRNFINSISVIKFILEFEKLYLKYKDKSYINFDIKNVDDDWKEDTRSINDASKFFDILKEIRNAACHFDQPFLSEDDLKIFKDTFSNIINYIQDEILKEEKNTNTKSIVKTYKTKKKIFNEGNEVLQKYIINKMNEFYDKYKK